MLLIKYIYLRKKLYLVLKTMKIYVAKKYIGISYMRKLTPLRSRPPRQIVASPSHITDTIILNSNRIIGNSIVMFTFIYTTLNWWHYKTLREKNEKLK